MNNRIIGEYEPGTFFLRYNQKNIPYENELYSSDSIGDKDSFTIYGDKSKGNYMKTERIITFLHEATHFIHDLSLPACTFADYLRDEIAFLSKTISLSCNDLRYPLLDKDNYEYNKKLLSEHYLHYYEILLDRIDFYKELFCTSYKLDNGIELSYNDLLEGYTHYKSVYDLIVRTERNGNYQYCRDYKNKSKLYPYSFKDGSLYVSENFYNGLSTYHAAKLFYIYQLGLNNDYFDYLENEWPENYFKSYFNVMETGFILLLDIALTIPSCDYVLDAINSKNYCMKDFSPVHRFSAAVKVVFEYGGFPDIKEGEPFYVTFFNFIAEHSKMNWPSYEDTISSWNHLLKNKIEFTGDISAGYRARLMKYKNTDFHKYILKSPLDIFRDTLIPIIYLVRGGAIKMIHLIGNANVPFEGVFNTYGLFVSQNHRFKACECEDQNELLLIEYDNSMSFIRESVYRSIIRNLQDAMIFKKNFTCCFYDNEFCNYICSTKDDKPFNEKLPAKLFCFSMDKFKCCNIKNFADLPKDRCAVRDYLKIKEYNIDNINW